ncbi:hypothetical protein EGR_04679 [Echinococcus granulosus]|uniref:Uncharacterized protein n=1 Tax=Echinococcus granulosus TaxID=6210 RepID=W6UG67_ECHGR|nr:hypothetical protein EGR_04679 [Echinococcus granulosus]EUB60485.1 hypothetical protein EGR_04679 [Echinococcus granulosus]
MVKKEENRTFIKIVDYVYTCINHDISSNPNLKHITNVLYNEVANFMVIHINYKQVCDLHTKLLNPFPKIGLIPRARYVSPSVFPEGEESQQYRGRMLHADIPFHILKIFLTCNGKEMRRGQACQVIKQYLFGLLHQLRQSFSKDVKHYFYRDLCKLRAPSTLQWKTKEIDQGKSQKKHLSCNLEFHYCVKMNQKSLASCTSSTSMQHIILHCAVNTHGNRPVINLSNLLLKSELHKFILHFKR